MVTEKPKYLLFQSVEKDESVLPFRSATLLGALQGF
jgi:hypothetical protein